MDSPKKNWDKALNVLLQPIVLLSLVLTIITGIFPDVFGVLFAPLFGIISSIAGGSIVHYWQKGVESSILTTTGESALRNLNRIIGLTDDIEGKIQEESSNIDEEGAKSAKQLLREVQGHLKGLKQTATNAIDDWKDILPNASLLEELNELKAISFKWQKTKKLNVELNNKLNEATEGKEELEKELEQSIEEAQTLRETYQNLETKFIDATGNPPEFYNSGSGVVVPFFDCKGCGCMYNIMDADRVENNMVYYKCESCGHDNQEPLTLL